MPQASPGHDKHCGYTAWAWDTHTSTHTHTEAHQRRICCCPCAGPLGPAAALIAAASGGKGRSKLMFTFPVKLARVLHCSLFVSAMCSQFSVNQMEQFACSRWLPGHVLPMPKGPNGPLRPHECANVPSRTFFPH